MPARFAPFGVGFAHPSTYRLAVRRRARFASLVLAALASSGAALAVDPPRVQHDCSLLSPVPRPCDNAVEIAPRSSIYLEVIEPTAGHWPTDPVDVASIVVTLKRGSATPVTVFGPNQVFAPGYSGSVTPQFNENGVWGYGVHIIPATALDSSTTYTVKVTGQNTVRHQPIDPNTNSWSFNTRRSLAGASVGFNIDLAAPTVTWPGRWFAGAVKPNFDTSRIYDQDGVYALFDRVHQSQPDFMLQARDFPWMGDYIQANFFDGNLNLVRERQTRRIVLFRDVGTQSELTLSDLIEGPLYGIGLGRLLSQDYRIGDRVLVCDATRSEVRQIAAINDSAKTIRIDKLATPANLWQPGDPTPPADDPRTPDNFTRPLAALRRFDPPGTPLYYWTRLDDELDQHVAHGRKPLVDIHDTPYDLCKTGVGENANGGVCGNEPKNYAQWHDFIGALVDHLIDRYGSTEVASWYFSIGNEPDLSPYWSQHPDDFLRYYDYTANAILRAFENRGVASATIKLGGPEDSGIFPGHENHLLYHCSPSAVNPSSGFTETNFVCTDANFSSKLSQRVAAICSANANRGCPLDYVSLHSYTHAATAAALIDGVKTRARSIDPVLYARLPVHSHETTPDWIPRRDPTSREIYRWGGFFPSWGADYFRRLLNAAQADPARAGGQSTITIWPFNYNFEGLASLAGQMRVDADGDGTQDRIDAVASPFLRFAELIGKMGHDLAPLSTVTDAGATLSGWRSTDNDADRVLLYAHDPRDVGSAEIGGWDLTLQLNGLRFTDIDVIEWRIDGDHGARAALASLPARGSNGLYTPAEVAPLIAADDLVPLTPVARYTADHGALTLTTHVQSQGVTFLEIVPARLDTDRDSIPDMLDNCVVASNPLQSDLDNDGRGDACDCAVEDPTVFAIPCEIEGVIVSKNPDDGTRIDWTSAAACSGVAVRYSVYREPLDTLTVGTSAEGGCWVDQQTATWTTDPFGPAAGTGRRYLVRAADSCGVGTWGRTTAGVERTAACP